MNIVFWQSIVSPHMAPLAQALAKRGCRVTYVSRQLMSDERKLSGWRAQSIEPARLVLAASLGQMLSILGTLPADSIHICQGLRSNGPISHIQRVLRRTGARHWAILETIDDHGLIGWLKRLEYRRLCSRHFRSGGRVLAIGDRTSDWLQARGMKERCIVPFCYFLPDVQIPKLSLGVAVPRSVRIAFAGRLIDLKRVEDVILAVAAIPTEVGRPELWIMGDGPAAPRLKKLAAALLPDRVRWFGMIDQQTVPTLLAQVDCLALPSRHDGWGAVVSEALLVGTPAICTDHCGAAIAVRQSGLGGVYPVGDVNKLTLLLSSIVASGALSEGRRQDLRRWASCLTVEAGAAYLEEVLSNGRHSSYLPNAPCGVSVSSVRRFESIG